MCRWFAEGLLVFGWNGARRRVQKEIGESGEIGGTNVTA